MIIVTMDWYRFFFVRKCYFYYRPYTVDVTIGFSTLDYVASESEECVEVIIEIQSPSDGAPRSFTVLLSTENSSAGMHNYYI